MYSNIKKGACRQLSNLDGTWYRKAPGRKNNANSFQINGSQLRFPYGQYAGTGTLWDIMAVWEKCNCFHPELIYCWEGTSSSRSEEVWKEISALAIIPVILNSWVESDREYMRRIRRPFLTHIISSICIILHTHLLNNLQVTHILNMAHTAGNFPY